MALHDKSHKGYYKEKTMEQLWDNISVGEFLDLRTIIADEGRSAEDRQIAIAALLQGVSEDELLTMPLDEAREAFALANSLDTPPKRSRIRRLYQVGAWTLRATESKDMTVAQWVDFQTFGRDMEKNIVEVLSVALVPNGKTYNEGYDIEALKRDIRNKMMIPDALAVCFFFQRKWLKSIQRNLNFLVGWTMLKGKKAKELNGKARQIQAEVYRMRRSL